jgi:hypothetical protein
MYLNITIRPKGSFTSFWTLAIKKNFGHASANQVIASTACMRVASTEESEQGIQQQKASGAGKGRPRNRRKE